MIECKICGHKVKYRLIEHIMKTHGMKVEEYKKTYGEYVSEEYKKIISERSKKKWKDDNYRKKIMDSRKHIYKDNGEKISKTLKEHYKNGGKTWNDGLTKKDNESLRIIGEKNSKNLKGRTKEKYEYLKKHSERMKEMWRTTDKLTYMGKCDDTDKVEKWKKDISTTVKKRWEEGIYDNKKYKDKERWRRNISKTISEKIAKGEIKNVCKHFKKGFYKNKKGKFWYDSGLELNVMKYMDENNIEWTNKHGIRIEYIKNDTKKVHSYVPDFLLNIGDEKIIIEMKGYPDEYLNDKKEAIEKIYNNYYICYTIDEVKEILDEIHKNKKNKNKEKRNI